jgi:hypothetical protein
VHALEDVGRLLRIRVVAHDGFVELLVLRELSHHGLVDRLVDEHIHAATRLDEARDGPRIAGKANRASAIIQPEAVGWLDRPMVDEKRRDGDAVLLVNGSFTNVVCDDLNAGCRRMFVDISTHVDVEGERLLEMRHHVARALRSPYLERDPAWRQSRPPGQQQVRDVDDVVGVQMGEKELAHRTRLHARLDEPLHQPAPRVEEKTLIAGFDERADARDADAWGRTGGYTEDRYANVAGRRTTVLREQLRDGRTEEERHTGAATRDDHSASSRHFEAPGAV